MLLFFSVLKLNEKMPSLIIYQKSYDYILAYSFATQPSHSSHHSLGWKTNLQNGNVMLALVNSKILHWPKVPFFFFLFFFSSQTAACSFQALCTLLFGNFLILFSNGRWSNSISLQKSYISTKVVWMSKTWIGWKINLEILSTNEFFMLVWLAMLLLITIFKIFLLIRQETRFISSNRIATRYCFEK